MKCRVCNGFRRLSRLLFSERDREDDCPICDGTGKESSPLVELCTECNGSGTTSHPDPYVFADDWCSKCGGSGIS